MYNSLIAKSNNVKLTFSTIDVMLKKRYDLIPNLVETVKEYMNYEKYLLTDITALRGKAILSGLSDADRVTLENQITQNLGRIMVAVENYPDLKANQNFLQLQATWTEMEEQISAARRTFNYAITEYNNAVSMFPSNIVAIFMDYKTIPFFEAGSMEREAPHAKDLLK
jgi:LemA protein